jgi:hypothetical protein
LLAAFKSQKIGKKEWQQYFLLKKQQGLNS